MTNIMVIPAYDVEQSDVEWQPFEYINTTEDLVDLYKRVKHYIPGVVINDFWVRNSHWASFRLPEYLDAKKIKATQYLILNRCMEFNKERRDQSVL